MKLKATSIKFLLSFFFLLQLLSFKGYSQKIKIEERDYENSEVEMADKLREDGKIYVVVAVMTTILLGLFVYTITIDRKITKLEREFNSKDSK